MGLYDDLPEAKSGPAAETSAAPVPPAWTAAALAPAVRRMAASASASASSAKQRPFLTTTNTTTAAAAPAPAPPIPPKQKQKQQQQQQKEYSNYYAASFGPFDDDFDEYDPNYPNDFAALVARRELAAEEARLRAEAAAGVAAAAAAAAEREKRIAAAAAEAAAAREREAKQKAAEEEEERDREREREEEEQPRAGLGSVRPSGAPSSDAAAAAAAAAPVLDSERGMPLAAKMMAKMGWEQGKGLGKQLQGAPLPLVAKKTSARAAVVVPAAEKGKEEQEGDKEKTAAALPTRPVAVPAFSWPEEGDDSSRVVLLTNVAPPGLSEEALGITEDEIGMAATASGGLRSVSVFEVFLDASSDSSSSYPREALVRVFVEFGGATEAGKFARSVRGQPFFNGNKARGSGGVVARPFSLARLREGRLAPEPGDIP